MRHPVRMVVHTVYPGTRRDHARAQSFGVGLGTERQRIERGMAAFRLEMSNQSLWLPAPLRIPRGAGAPDGCPRRGAPDEPPLLVWDSSFSYSLRVPRNPGAPDEPLLLVWEP